VGFGGASWIPKTDFSTSVIGSASESSRAVRLEYASGYQIGGRVSEHLGDFWSVSLEYSFANQPVRFRNLSPEIQSLSLGHSLHHLSYDVSYLPLPPMSRFRPYVKAGAGPALFYLHGSSKDEARQLGLSLRDSWEFSFNWGGGFKFLAADQVVLGVDVRDNVTGIPSYGLPRNARVVNGQFQPGLAGHGFLHNVQVNFGIGVQWDE
jgi:opacity protein-like surface antigen